MKKLTLFATALAAVFAASSCSSDVLEESNQAPKGKPFVVNVTNNDGSRGADITAVESFKMYGIQAGQTNPWINGNALFTKTGDVWGNSDVSNWPTTTGTHTFYATCDNTGDAPAIAADGTFDYTVPAAVASQKDLLVAAVTDAAHETPVALTFKHALSSLKAKIGIDINQFPSSDIDMVARVKKITFYNIATKGTFDFSKMNTDPQENPWTVDTDNPTYQDITIEFDTPLELTPVNGTANFAVATSDVSRIFVLPHKPASWIPVVNDVEQELNKTTNSYIGITCQLFIRTGATAAVELGVVGDVATALGERTEEPWSSYNEAQLEEAATAILMSYADGTSELDEDLVDVVSGYIETYSVDNGGLLSTENGSWLKDKVVDIKAPLDYGLKMFESDIDACTADDDYEEIYLPIIMTNGFGFNKTNTINLHLLNTRRADGYAVTEYVEFDIGG